MADLLDVMDALEQIAITAVFPQGTSLPSVSGHPVDVGQGWPLAVDIDAAMKANRALVSIFAVPGATAVVEQFLNDPEETVAAPVHGLSAVSTNAGFSLTGAPAVGEYVTVVVDKLGPVTYDAVANDTASIVATALAAQIAGASALGGAVALPNYHALIVRIGAPGTVARILHRQKQQFRLSVWAPSPSQRAAVSKPLDVVLKQNLRLVLPDGSQSIVRYENTMLDDKYENAGTYRRDLVFSVEYATTEVFPAYEITAVSFTTTGDNQSAFAA